MQDNGIKLENEEKKTFLKAYQEAKKAERRIETQIQEIQQNKLSPSGLHSDGMPHGKHTQDLSDYVAKIDELERKLWRERERKLMELERIQTAIEALTNEDEKTILAQKYIKNKKWAEIALDMGYEERTIYYKHGNALSHLAIPK